MRSAQKAPTRLKQDAHRIISEAFEMRVQANNLENRARASLEQAIVEVH